MCVVRVSNFVFSISTLFPFSRAPVQKHLGNIIYLNFSDDNKINISQFVSCTVTASTVNVTDTYYLSAGSQ